MQPKNSVQGTRKALQTLPYSLSFRPLSRARAVGLVSVPLGGITLALLAGIKACRDLW